MSEQLGETVEQPAKLRDLASNKSIIGNIIITTSGRVQKWWFADRDEFAEYCEFWRENGESFSLNRLSKSPANEEGNPATRMTDRQREAVLTAYEMGYLAPLT